MTELERCEDHEIRLAKLETLLTNHIPHINAALDRLEWWIRGIAVASFLALIGAIIDHFVR